ncbi:YlbD family protein [Gottfriedia luciferensis]|uniref:YlbD family protein n=1 Tax=Gottfriedia luciferensis TaxID=178774 RepID=UPI001302DA6C|nr:YlbD family protein [Gottfriedia luciferensis]
MRNEKNRPSIDQFRQFVMDHPKLRDEVNAGKKTWQQYFEDWYLYGADHEMWDAYRNESRRSDPKNSAKNVQSEEGYVGKVISFVKNLDPDQIQDHLSNVNSTLSNIQQLISQFKSPAASSGQREEKQVSQPFNFRQD